MLSFKKNHFLSFHSSILHSKFISILHVKWTEINKGEQVKKLKFWVNILFESPQSLLAATKIYILIFNLTHSLISLVASFHFPQWKIFFPIHWQILKACVPYFDQILFFHQMIALQKLWKMLFSSSKKLFSFSRYSNFFIFVLPSFSTCRPLLWRMIEDKS